MEGAAQARAELIMITSCWRNKEDREVCWGGKSGANNLKGVWVESLVLRKAFLV